MYGCGCKPRNNRAYTAMFDELNQRVFGFFFGPWLDKRIEVRNLCGHIRYVAAALDNTPVGNIKNNKTEKIWR